jgi:SAM-dependent methyltransferase
VTSSQPTRTDALVERTVPGLHDAIIAYIGSRLRPGMKAVDLGTGSGAFAARLEFFGCKVTACDSDATAYSGHSSFKRLDLDQPTFAQDLGHGEFDVVSAIEVIEHLEAPMRFLAQIRSLLGPGGFAVVATPNVDSLSARAKFLLKGTLRMFDQHGDPTHASPIFWDLLNRQYLPRAHLELAAHAYHPPNGFIVGRPPCSRCLSVISPTLRGRLVGANHILVLAPK